MEVEILSALVAGVGLGAIYGLVASSYTLILAATGVFNLAQGVIVVLGAIMLLELWQFLGLPFFGALVIILATGSIAGVVTYLVAISPLMRRRDSSIDVPEAVLVTTLGLSLAASAIGGITFGDETVIVNYYVSSNPIHLGNVAVAPIYLVMAGVAIAVLVALELIMHFTNIGLMLRATVQDSEGAGLVAINVRAVILIAFGLAGLLSALAGVMIVPVTSASIFIADNLLLFGFVAMAIGGYGSFVGAMVGGLFVGIVSNLVPVFMNPDWTNIIIFAFLVVLLLVRPTGLFGAAGAFGSRQLREV